MENALARSLLAALAQPALFVTQDQRVAAANAPARLLLGDGLEARHFALSLRHPQAITTIEAALTTGTVGKARISNIGAATDAVFRLTVTPVGGGGTSGVLCLFEDVSDAEQIGQMRREFVANVSHELRTPLTALLGFIETLRGAARDDPVARDKFLQIMAREAGRMNRLVSDLLALSQVEAAERVRPSDSVDLVAVAVSTAAAMRPLADQAGRRIVVDGLPSPVMVKGDADQLVQVFQNLLENAVKYGGGERVTVTITRGEERPMGGPVIIAAVRDEGEGIDPIHLPRLTERFYRVDSHRSREQGGTGLGLAIVKHIINRHRGRLRINSVPGQGSTFTIILPESQDNPVAD
jgi:two-component system, OmpR family, phosphate regulon sensor histidine kinase PhoR